MSCSTQYGFYQLRLPTALSHWLQYIMWRRYMMLVCNVVSRVHFQRDYGCPFRITTTAIYFLSLSSSYWLASLYCLCTLPDCVEHETGGPCALWVPFSIKWLRCWGFMDTADTTPSLHAPDFMDECFPITYSFIGRQPRLGLGTRCVLCFSVPTSM